MDWAQIDRWAGRKKKLEYLQYQGTTDKKFPYHQKSQIRVSSGPTKKTNIFQKFLLISFYIVTVVPQKRPDVFKKLK